MEELVKLVSKKTGLPEAQARQAATVVVGYLKDKLPAPLASQVDNVLDGDSAAGPASDVMKGLGGLLKK